jgi:hypothetical protein
VHYIGLGRDCQVAIILRDLQIRRAAYPLDWMVCSNFYGVIEVFKDDFKYFLDPNFLIYKESYIENSYYQFGYNHFFPIIGFPIYDDIHIAGTIVPNFLDHLPAVQATQGKRIQRLLDLLSSDEKIVFIRTHAMPDEARAFVHAIEQKYPHLKFRLVVVHERQDLIGDWNIPKVLNFYACQRSGDHDWWIPQEWANIIQAVQANIPKRWR